MNGVDDVVAKAATSLPDFRRSQCLLCASDYSGQHKTARFETYAFVVVDLASWRRWEELRLAVRSGEVTARTMSFKGLNDELKRRALPGFLDAAEELHGVVAVIAVDKDIGSLFGRSRKFDFSELAEFREYGPDTFERLLRTVHFLSLFIAGLSYPYQDVFWFTDADAIAANERRVRTLTGVFGHIVSHYLSHNLRHLRCGTSATCDNGSMQVEDLCALADLSAGAVCELLCSTAANSCVPSSPLITPVSKETSRKSRYIGAWLARPRKRLNRLMLILESQPPGTSVRITRMHLHDLGLGETSL
jgi:hypothetical protein